MHPSLPQPLPWAGSSESKQHTPAIAVVTGGSRGLGCALVSQLAQLGFIVLRAQRTVPATRGRAPPHGNVKDFWLDLANSRSVQGFCEQLLDQLPYIDLLINNAATCLANPPDVKSNHSHWKTVMDVNFFAHVTLTESLLPLLQRSGKHPRVINVSSGDGELLYFSEYLRLRIEKLDACSTTKRLTAEVEDIVADLLDAGCRNQQQEMIFGGQHAYKLSKAALNTYTRHAARRCTSQMIGSSFVAFMSICPGDVDTCMADQGAALVSPYEAVHRLLPILDVGVPCKNGVFLRHGEEISW